MHKIFHICYCLVMAMGLCVSIFSQEKTWNGSLVDKNFSDSSAVRLEILESGDTLNVVLGEPFSITIPADTLWNVCFTQGALEKCFEITHKDTSSQFSFDVTGKDTEVLSELAPPKEEADLNLALPESDSLDYSAEAPSSYNSEEGVQLKKVLLKVRRVPKRALGKSTVSAKMIKRMPGLAEADVIKAIQALPGVVASSDFSSKIYVRGGSADQNLFLFDNGTVYSPVHFFGLFSTFLVEGLDGVEFYKGGFSPRYGNRLSSVVDIKSRKGGAKDTNAWFHKSSVKVSTFATQIHTEGRQGPVNWILAGRATYIKTVIDLLRNLGLTDLELDYFFTDLQGHVNWQINENHSLDISGYGGGDKLDFSPFIVKWGNQVYPLNYHHKISDNWKGHATFAYSWFSQEFALENIFGFENGISQYNYKHVLDYSGFKNQNLQLGLDIKKFHVEFVNNQEIAKIRLTDPTDFWMYSAFVENDWDWDKLNLKLGVRGNYMTERDVVDFEPRFSLQLKLPKSSYIDFHSGYYYQYINSIVWGDFETINEFYYPAKKLKYETVEPSHSLLLSLGYRKEKLWDRYEYSVESYYKTLNDLVVFNQYAVEDSVRFDAGSALGELLKNAEGYSFGLELMGRKNGGTLFGGLSLSLGQAVIKEQFATEAIFPKWHQPISFKGDLSINWRGEEGIWKISSKRKYLQSSVQLKHASGLPYTEVVGYVPAHLLDQNPYGVNAGGPNPIFGNNVSAPRGGQNDAFVPSYFRLDVKAIDWGKKNKWNFSWTILNITDYENIFLYAYDTSKNPPERLEITQFPFFPMLVSYEYYF